MGVLVALGGAPGSGKTHLRTQHPVLSSLQCLDISDIYTALEAEGRSVDVYADLFIKIVQRVFQAHPNACLVVEALLRPGGIQRDR